MVVKPIQRFLLLLALAAGLTVVAADTLVLRTGESLEGNFVGASGDIIYLRVEGEIRQFSLDEVSSIRFEKERSTRLGTNSGDRSGWRAVIVGAGAVITVAFSQRLLTDNLREGQVFRTKLAESFKSGDTLLAPAGSNVYGKIVQHESGDAGMVLTQMVVAGEPVSIRTEPRRLPGEGEILEKVSFRLKSPFTLRVAVGR